MPERKFLLDYFPDFNETGKQVGRVHGLTITSEGFEHIRQVFEFNGSQFGRLKLEYLQTLPRYEASIIVPGSVEENPDLPISVYQQFRIPNILGEEITSDYSFEFFRDSNDITQGGIGIDYSISNLPSQSYPYISSIGISLEKFKGFAEKTVGQVVFQPNFESYLKRSLQFNDQDFLTLYLIDSAVLAVGYPDDLAVELTKQDLQRFGINGRLTKDIDEVILNFAAGGNLLRLGLSTVAKADYVQRLFDFQFSPVTDTSFLIDRRGFEFTN